MAATDTGNGTIVKSLIIVLIFLIDSLSHHFSFFQLVVEGDMLIRGRFVEPKLEKNNQIQSNWDNWLNLSKQTYLHEQIVGRENQGEPSGQTSSQSKDARDKR